MVVRTLFDKTKNISHASWAVWPDGWEDDKDASGVSVFEESNLSEILPQLNPDIILASLNPSGTENHEEFTPFLNFHGSRNDRKLCHAIRNTPLWGAYMTDVISGVRESKSGKLMKRLKQDESLRKEKIQCFFDEISSITTKPVIFAFGNDAHVLIEAECGERGYILHKLTHFSYRFHCNHDFEKYRERVMEVIRNSGLGG